MLSLPPDDPASTIHLLGDANAFVDAVETVLEVFGQERISWRRAVSLRGYRAARIVAAAEPYMARAGLLTTAAVVRWAAKETGRPETEILAELRRSLND